ncbi:MAG TPA: helix-hairpin-helix domain-containing protein [Gemmatimonadales bacterium]|nr:helix-hairpin-helix domain-containing protein [Gemmatimonadales bacterium]
MSPTERRALFLLLALGLVGQGVRWVLLRPGQAPGGVELLAALPPKSPAAHRDSIAALSRPLGADERIDADKAGALELARLPRVGPALARAIVAHREAHGPFGGLQGLDGVPGIGPGLLAAISPHLTFSAPGQPASVPAQIAAPSGVEGCGTPGHPGPCPSGRLNLNLASVAALDSLPGIGPTRAASIVQYRASHGPFRSVHDLGQVAGIGPAALARIRDLVTAP